MDNLSIKSIQNKISKYEKIIKLNKFDVENRLKLAKYILSVLQSINMDDIDKSEEEEFINKISEYIQISLIALAEVLKIDNKNYEAYNTAGQLGIFTFVFFEQKNMFDQIVFYFEKAIEVGSKFLDAYLNYAGFLSYYANTNDDDKENSKLLLKAVDLYRKLIELDKNDYIYYNFLGMTLFQLSVYQKNKTVTKKYLNEAIEQYYKASTLNKDDYTIYNGLAFTFYSLFEFETTVKNKVDLLLKSADNYEKVIKLNHDDYVPLKNYGDVLLNLAKLKKKKEDKLPLHQKSLKIIKTAVGLCKVVDYDLYVLLRDSLIANTMYADKNRLINIYTELKDLSEQMLDIDKEDFYNYYGLGDSYYMLSTFEENVEVKEKMLEKSVQFFDFLAKKWIIGIPINYNFAIVIAALANIKKDKAEKMDLLKKAKKIIKKIIKEVSINPLANDYKYEKFLVKTEREIKELK